MITKKAYPRVSIAGNPSDGFWGRCVSATFYNYSASCSILVSNDFSIEKDACRLSFRDKREISNLFPLSHPCACLEKNRLALAAVKTFFDFCDLNDRHYEEKGFRLIYDSNIPFSLGFSGSTAISISILKALDEFYGTHICDADVESMALHSETHELKRYAGPQDPVAVNRNACVYMDFTKESYMKEACGENLSWLEKAVVHADYSSSDHYLSNHPMTYNGALRNTVMPEAEKMDIKDAPFFIITRGQGSDSSIELSPEITAYKGGDKKLIYGMEKIALLAEEAREAIRSKDFFLLGNIINENFRLSVEHFDNDYLGRENIKFVQEAINTGAYAKFPGSGGAVFGIYPDEAVFDNLKGRFKSCKIEKLKLVKD
jgi:glucuronokinase